MMLLRSFGIKDKEDQMKKISFLMRRKMIGNQKVN